MKQQEVFKKIGGIVREINEQYDYLLSVEGAYNDLELELMLANANFLAGHIEILRKVNARAPQAAPGLPVPPVIITPPPATEPPAPEAHFFAPVPAEEPQQEDAAPEAHTIEFKIDNKIAPAAEPEPEQIRHELTLEDIGEDWDEEEDEVGIEPAAELEQPQPVPAAITEPTPVEVKAEPVFTAPTIETERQPEPMAATAEHTQILVPEEQVLTLNERMSAQMNASRMSDQLVGQPIADLKSAITLNDKLLYIKDLFNGYSLAYSEALDILNRYKSLEEAQAFLNASYATKNNWADKQATVDKFYALLQRRYM